MKNKLKRSLKKIVNSFGYEILKKNTNNKLIKNKKEIKITTTSKNNLLSNFYNIMIQQNYFPKSIYDIGANKGTWTKECLNYFPLANYYLFEPQINLKKDIELLLKGVENIKLFSVGVGNVNDELNFTIHDRDDSCSFDFTESEAKLRGFEQIKVPIVTLDGFVFENNLMPPDLLKIDAEGLDIQVLEGAENLLSNVEIIMVEVGIMNKRITNTALKMMNYLDKKGFILFDITDLNRPFSNNVLLLCEFVFIKKNGVLDKNYSYS